MRFGREVHNREGSRRFEQRSYNARVSNVASHECVTGTRGDVRKVEQVSCIGELVKDHDAPVGPRQNSAYKVATDEAGSAGDNNSFRHWRIPTSRRHVAGIQPTRSGITI